MKNNISVEEALEQLKSIKAPPCKSLSYQQIIHTINETQREKAPKSLLMSCIIGILLVLAGNFWAIDKKTNSKEQNFVEEMGLISNLSIYG